MIGWLLAAALAQANPVDAYFEKRWKDEGVVATPRADDHAFLRRLTLDVLGRLPKADEVRAFEKSADRAALIDALLAHPDAAEFFADTWTRILLNYRFEEQTPLKMNFPAFRPWLKEAWSKDLPYREFVAKLLGDHGDNAKKPASNFLLAALDPAEPPHEAATRTTRVFLGRQIHCARCHDHPFEKLTQEEFWAYTAFFDGLSSKARTTFDGFGIKLMQDAKGSMTIPDTKTEVRPRYFDGRTPPEGAAPLKSLATFVSEDPQASRAIVNRLWGHFMGRGFVEPVDKFTEKSKPAHPELLEALRSDFERDGTRLKPLIRTILTSKAYQLSTSLKGDVDASSHAAMALKPLNPVQVLNVLTYSLQMDAFLQQFYQGYLKNFGDDNFFAKAYGNAEVFRMFLHLFAQGLLAPSGVAPEESRYTGSVRLALKLMNGTDLQNLVKAEWGLLAEILKKHPTPEARVTEIFYALLSRPPKPDEQDRLLAHARAKKNDKRAYEDLFWVLLNSSEMIFNH